MTSDQKAILALTRRIAELEAECSARQRHIERLCNRTALQCAARGCDGCAVCDPVAALSGRG